MFFSSIVDRFSSVIIIVFLVRGLGMGIKIEVLGLDIGVDALLT